MNTIQRLSWRNLMTFGLTALSSAALLLACDSDGGFKETKSGSIEFNPSTIGFSPVLPGQGSTDFLLRIDHGGERAVVISEIYLARPNESGELVPIEGCDRITEGVDPSTILTAEVLEGCELLITERPALPAEIDNNSFEQVLLTYRPLLDAPDPSAVKLVVKSNATGMFEERLDISVSSAQPELVTERVIEFASTGENTKNHLVRNNSSANLRVQNIRIERNVEGSPAPTDPQTGEPLEEFTWDSTCFPCVLNSTQTAFMSVQVTYSPQDDVGPDKATMIIEAVTDSGEPLAPVEVLLTTEATPTNLTINPDPMIFNPAPNQEGRLDVSFVNGGLASLSVYKVSFEPERGPFTLRGGQDSFSVQAGGAYSAVVFALPSEVRAGTMVVETDADNAINGVIRVPITVGGGEAVPLLTSDVSSLSFDGVLMNESAEGTVTLLSNGSDPVNISEIRVDGDSEVFEVIEGAELSSLEVGESAPITVRFTRPEAAPGAPLNTYAGTLVIVNDGLGGDVTVNLSASPTP